MKTMATASLPWQLLLASQNRHSSLRHASPVQAFRRCDLDGFAKRVASGEALRDAWRSANEGFENLVLDARRAAFDFDRRFSISRRLDYAARSATGRARHLDRELGLERRWRTFTMDFFRNFPRYRRELNGFLKTPLGKISATIFFLWFALSGWLFRILIVMSLAFPIAAPLLIGSVANTFVIEGACPACKQGFVGYRYQIIQCKKCRNIVWQPGSGSSTGSGPSLSKEADIVDIEIEEK